MNKLLLIIKREYISRVTSKSFILTTLLTPLAIVLFTAVVTLIFSYETDEIQNIAVVDEAKILDGSIRDEENLFFHFEKKSLKEVLSGIEKISAATATTLFDALERMMASEANWKYYYEVAYDQIIEDGARFSTVDISGLKWVEIDTQADYVQALREFAPI